MMQVVVQQLSPVFATPWTAAHQASLSFTISCSLLKLMSIESVMPSNHLIFCCPLLLLSVFLSISQSSPMHFKNPIWVITFSSHSISPSSKLFYISIITYFYYVMASIYFCIVLCLLCISIIIRYIPNFSSVQSVSCVWLFVTPWTAARQASLSITNSRSSSKPMSIESVMPSNHLILCHPLLLLPSIFPSIRVFSNESTLCIRWPNYLSFSCNISPSNEHPGLISFRMDWLDLLAVQGTLKSLLQHHSSKASVLWCSAFFIVQILHPYMATGKTIALTRWTFVDKVISLLFNMLSRLVLTFFPRSKHLLISWL